MKKILTIIILLFISLFLNACDLSIIQGSTTYTISFDTNGGSSVFNYSYNAGIIVSSDDLEEPTYEGYQFEGWYTDSDLTVAFINVTNQNITLYAKWAQLFTITWEDADGTVLETDVITEGEMPVYNSEYPTKADDETYSYTFNGWNPNISSVYSDQTYTATYTSTQLVVSTFDETELNTIVNYDLYSYMPTIITEDFIYTDESDETQISIYIDLLDWTLDDAQAYTGQLDLLLPYDSTEEAWIVDDYYLYVYSDDSTYPGTTVYGIYIYGERVVRIDTWEDLILALNDALSYDSFDPILPVLDDLDHIVIDTTTETISFSADTSIYNNTTAISEYYSLLISDGWYLDNDLTDTYGSNVYVYEVLAHQAFGLYLIYTNTEITVYIWSFDPDPIIETSDVFTNETSMTIFEEEHFGITGLPSVGTNHVLVIPIEMAEHPFPSNYKEQLEATFNGTAEETGWQSVSSYYSLSSYGLLNLTFDIVDKYSAPDTEVFYESYGTSGDQYAIVDAINDLDSEIDYSQYDYNDDGVIDSIIFIYSTPYDYDTDPWWAWVFDSRGGVADSINNVDGKSFEYYMWASYWFSNDSIYGNTDLIYNAETYIHELGHLMGLTDLYTMDYDYGPLGGWDMMDYNVGDHGPMNKLLLGWLQPTIVDSGTETVTLDSYSTDTNSLDNTIIIPYNSNDLEDGDAFDEYLLIMFYTPTGLYEGHLGTNISLSQAGVIVYHVDARNYSPLYFWGYYFAYNNDGDSDFLVEILEADMNNSIPSNSTPIAKADTLRYGTFDLSYYQWHQGGNIDVTISVMSTITNNSNSVTLSITVN